MVKKSTIIGLICIIILAVVVVVWNCKYVLRNDSQNEVVFEGKKAGHKNINQVVSDEGKSLNVESDFGDIETLNVLTFPTGQFLLKINLNVPKSWRATLETRDNLDKQIYSSYNDNLVVFKFLSPFYVDSQESGLMPNNQLGFYDVTDWITEDTKDSAYYLGGIKAPKKKEFFDFLLNLRNEKQNSDFSACKDIFIYNCGGSEKTYVESSDGLFSGFVSVRTSPHVAQYDPTAYVYMAGNIEGKIIYISGNFILYDEIDKEIDKDEFKRRRDEILNVLDSIHLSSRSR